MFFSQIHGSNTKKYRKQNKYNSNYNTINMLTINLNRKWTKLIMHEGEQAIIFFSFTSDSFAAVASY